MLPKGLPLSERLTVALNAFGLTAMLLLAAAPSFAANSTGNPGPAMELALQSASSDVLEAKAWVMQERDNHGLPFAIVDKKSARLFVFDAQGQLRGASAALLGLTPGDSAASSLDAGDFERLRAADRTTPAGRFVSEPGHNLQGEAIVWVDYASGLAIHRLRPAPAHERRPARLASATPDDNRISLGCVVIPVRFYEQVVAPVLGKSYGVVYVLPETRPLQHMLRALQLGQL